jgi:hypothetical protein
MTEHRSADTRIPSWMRPTTAEIDVQIAPSTRRDARHCSRECQLHGRDRRTR